MKSTWCRACALAVALLAGATSLAADGGRIQNGEQAPAWTLKNQSGKDVSLSGLLEKDKTLALVFYRSADW